MRNRKSSTLFYWLAMLTLFLTSCSSTTLETPPESGTVAVEDVQNGETKWIDPNELQQGPIQRDSLTAVQIQRIASLQKVFVEIDGQTVAQWADNFIRDLNPDSELALWERMATAYSRYCDKHKQLTLAAKNEVYKVILLRSMASPDDVIARLELTILTKQDARDVMEGF
ncbi:hypothetical protein [Flavobacterium sp.]|jgi:hypothetical protein|uniref:hypothetical protein n=1 Tax=Flavobacterium sp. TaxID=239 RepID=UPI0037C0C440